MFPIIKRSGCEATMTKPPRNAIRESEEELIQTAQTAVSHSNWVVGECAGKWTKKYAKGRTDAEFGASIGLSGDQVYQRRRVWETFSDVSEEYPTLKWSHFYVALNWDDASESLAWAEEQQATVSEMRAWRRAQRGEDLTEQSPVDDWGVDPTVSFVPSEPTAVRDPAEFNAGGAGGTGATAAGRETRDALSGVARGAGSAEPEYTPYRRGAGSPAPKTDEAGVVVAERPQPSPEQLLKRMTSSLERLNTALTPEMVKQFRKLPEKPRSRFVQVVGEFSSKVAGLI